MNVFKRTDLSNRCAHSIPYLAGANAGILTGVACVAIGCIMGKVVFPCLIEVLIPNAILKPLGLLDESDFED